jgi:hypothetical protein
MVTAGLPDREDRADIGGLAESDGFMLRNPCKNSANDCAILSHKIGKAKPANDIYKTIDSTYDPRQVGTLTAARIAPSRAQSRE